MSASLLALLAVPTLFSPGRRSAAAIPAAGSSFDDALSHVADAPGARTERRSNADAREARHADADYGLSDTDAAPASTARHAARSRARCSSAATESSAPTEARSRRLIGPI